MATPHPPRPGLAFEVRLSLVVQCARCGVPAPMPTAGKRFPVRDGDALLVTGDTRCRCGARRLRITIRI